LVAAGLAMYGPRTSLLIATAATEGVVEFVLTNSATPGTAEWRQSNVFTTMTEDQPFQRAIFAPGNLRATAANAGYRRFVDSCIDKSYNLRYSGGMVPDVAQLLVKGCGIFTNPDGGEAAPARLRLLYEALPAAFLVEKLAGGASSDGQRSLLDVVVEDTDQRVQVALGGKADVARFEEMVGYAVPSRS
jgi:sedoheptulose-bisphosphatase